MPPRLTKLGLWKRHEERVCEVLARALTLLQNESNLIQNEFELNRHLHFCLRKANAYLRKRGRGVDNPFICEAQNQPSPDHREKHEREDKRPDFQNGFIDDNETDECKQDKFFCIECKRLGYPPTQNWILNENYVNNGVARFIKEQHGYGLEVESGAMVGYVETSDFDVILQEINASLAKIKLRLLETKPQDTIWTSTECNLLENAFDRPFPISPFTLKHFWIDLRGKLTPPPPKPLRKTKTKKSVETNTPAEKAKTSGTRKRSSEKSKPNT